MTVTLASDESGRKALVRGEWTPDDAAAIRRSGARRLDVSVRGQNLDFLGTLDGIDEVRVVNHILTSDSGVTGLPGLRVLELETYSDDPIDFRTFGSIERLAFNWRPNGETAFTRTSLVSLSVGGYPHVDLAPLASLVNLEGLRLDNTRRLRSLEGIAAFSHLQVLSIRDGRTLVDIDALATMDHSLIEIEVDGCRRFTDISALRNHDKLRRIMLIDCGRISSLAPLADLPELEEFWFYGTTTIDDGDMSPLLRMPALKRVSFGYHKHYTHRTEDIERLRDLKESNPLPHWRW